MLLTCADLFSGIGSFSLGLHRTGRIKTVLFCENNSFRAEILRLRFGKTPIYTDIKEADLSGTTADIVIGGPPCQKTSVAAAIHGKRTGETLWPYMLKAGVDLCAKWFVVEQPAGNAEWEKEVSAGLARNGYHSARVEFAACDVGAVSQRRRLFILANRDLPRLARAWEAVPSKIETVKGFAASRRDWSADFARILRVDARAPHRLDRRQRIEALGDCNPPQMIEVIGLSILHAEGGL